MQFARQGVGGKERLNILCESFEKPQGLVFHKNINYPQTKDKDILA